MKGVSTAGSFEGREADSPPRAEMEGFTALVRNEGERLYRDLPWRRTRDPYAIWISEVMLQQTQVARVLTRWERFMERFPSIDALSAAARIDLLEEWQGMGYNRRALALKQAADLCSAQRGGRLPESYDELVALPGIGPSTAAGIMAFAHDLPSVYIETNVRAVFIHHFFPDAEKVSDRQLRPLVEASCPAQDPRGWYYALLDYGAELKRRHKNPARKAAAYTRQSPFAGSRRQKRAWLLREVMAQGPCDASELARALSAFEEGEGRPPVDKALTESILEELARDGFVRRTGSGWEIL